MATEMMGQAIRQQAQPIAQEAPTPGLDTPETAGGPQAADPSEETFVQMVAGLRNHIFGQGEQGIAQRMSEAGDSPDQVARVLGELTFALVWEAAKQAEAAQRELDMDMLMGVATEVIDDISELMTAHGMQITDQMKHDALMYANQIYVENSNPTDEERAAAKQTLADQRQVGEVDKAVSYVQKRGMEAGADPFDVAGMKGAKPGMMGRDTEEG
jgi:hypothetical protein